MGLIDRLLSKRYPFRFVYTSEYWMVDLGRHVFPVRKYRLIYERLLAQGVRKDAFLESVVAADEDILRVHSPKWVRKLQTGDLARSEIQALELPYLPELTRFVWLHMGGTVLTAETALREGLAVHIGGGFHHAFADRGEGFCALNDTVIALEKLLATGRVARPMIIDLDVHQGNGTAAMLAGRQDVFTYSLHQMDIYPAEKPPSSLDVGLWSGDGDEKYLAALRADFPRVLDEFKPDFVFYLAGADPLAGDKLGGLKCSLAGLAERDRLVLDEVRKRGIPTAVELGGGYGLDLNDTVQAHLNTIQAARQAQRSARRAALRRRLTNAS
jgi:acetoin utilization deacetylase AcuC-like enzyme